MHSVADTRYATQNAAQQQQQQQQSFCIHQIKDYSEFMLTLFPFPQSRDGRRWRKRKSLSSGGRDVGGVGKNCQRLGHQQLQKVASSQGISQKGWGQPLVVRSIQNIYVELGQCYRYGGWSLPAAAATTLFCFIWLGIPQPFRGLVWQMLCGAHNTGVKSLYADFMKQASPCEKLIRRDIARTYPEHEFFR